VTWLERKAQELYSGNSPAIKAEDLKEFASIVIEIQIMKKNLLKFKDELQERQDLILDDYDRIQSQRKNKLRLYNLRSLI